MRRIVFVSVDTIKASALASLQRIPERTFKATPKLTADAVLTRPNTKAMIRTTEKVVVVRASTGGTEALRVFLEATPMDSLAIVIVQHMHEAIKRGGVDMVLPIESISGEVVRLCEAHDEKNLI